MKKGGRPALEINSQHSIEELKAHFRTCSCAVERRRTQVVWWILEGRGRKEVMELSAYSNFSVVEIIKRYNEQGLAGLRDQRHENPGAPSLLRDEEMLLLAQVVHKDFEKGIVWNGAKVLDWLDKELGKKLHISRAYETLAKIGFSPQMPRPAHSQADARAQEQFKKNAT
jgi:transposase